MTLSVLLLCLNLACLPVWQKRCLAALADTLTAQRMTKLSLWKSPVTMLECVCPCWLLLKWQFFPVDCEYTGLSEMWKVPIVLRMFLGSVPLLEDVEVYENCWLNGRSHLFMSRHCCFVSAVLLLTGWHARLNKTDINILFHCVLCCWEVRSQSQLEIYSELCCCSVSPQQGGWCLNSTLTILPWCLVR